jgi:hypothetical protein
MQPSCFNKSELEEGELASIHAALRNAEELLILSGSVKKSNL